jgi:methyl-coenzyme M reductase subunit D
MIQPDNAEKFLDGLSYIPGIRRLLVHGPGYQKNTPKKARDFCESPIPTSTEVKISKQNVNMHVLMGDVIIEAFDEKALLNIANYCEEFFESYPFQILEGKFMKTEPSLSDYFSKDPNPDPYFVGLSDYKPHIEPLIIKSDCSDQDNN